MKQILLLFSFLFSLLASQALAQSKLSDKPAEFISDAKALLLLGKGPNAEALGTNLEELWNSGKLSAKQQQEIVNISLQMYKKRMRIRPHFEQFFGMLTDGASRHNLRGSALDKMLDVVAKSVKQEDMANLERFLATSSLYLSSDMLFENKFQRVMVSGGSFSFEYEGGPATKLEGKETSSNADWENISWDDEVASEEENNTDDGWGNIATPAKKVLSKQEQAQQAKQRFIPTQPKVAGPALKLENVVLTFITPHDSVSIRHTSGHVVLAHQLFVGEGGSYEWQVNGNPASVIFRKYSFSVAAAAFKAPDATLTFASVLKEPIEGAFEFKSIKRGSNGETGYPKFISFTDNAKLKNLEQNLAYRGGLSLAGNVVGSRSLEGKPSEIVVSHKGERKFRTLSDGFVITDSLLTAAHASVEIYQGEHLLTHPAMQLVYSKKDRALTLTREKGVYSNTPFQDNYHQLEILAERLYWDLATADIEFITVSNKMLVPVRLESMAYFSNSQYQQLVGVATFHPLKPLVAYATRAKTNEFNVSEVAKYTRIPEDGIRDAANRLFQLGYIDYDAPLGQITLKQKAWHYVGSAQHKNDYDHIVIKSLVPSGRNATLNLETNELEVRGVRKVSFTSDTTSIYIVPDSSTIRILANRNFEFDGEVHANELAFKGSDFKFDYNEFAIDLQKLQSMTLRPKDPKAAKAKSKTINEVVAGKNSKFAGKVYINRPDNKSGKENLSDYPKFDAITGGEMTFASPNVLGGAYDTTVYFEMFPFKLDSLSDSRQGVVGFKGKFHSGGMMPSFETKIIKMEDGSMGFYHKAPAEGIPLFGGKGVVYDSIIMDANGLQSKGRLKYLTATLEAPSFTFYQDSVLTPNGTSLTMAATKAGGADLPEAKLAGFSMRWLPKTDTMHLRTLGEPMKLYKEPFSFDGTAKISPGGLYASGKLDSKTSFIASEQFVFHHNSFTAKDGELALKSDIEEKPALNAQHVHVDYDIAKGLVDFEIAKKGAASIEFPNAQYKASLSSGTWDIARQKVRLKANEDNANNLFYSLQPEQAGLRFKAASGEYDLKSNTLRAIGVPHIAVADTYIVPDSGKVEITTGAVIKPLQNAAIMADSLHQYHKMHAGNIRIISRNAFEGEALYAYQGGAAEPYELRFSDFAYGAASTSQKNARLHTSAMATVGDASPFPVFPSILYRGKVAMHSSQQYMDFDGSLKLNFSGNEADTDWFPFKRDSLNPEKVLIPIMNPQTADGTPLHTGLHMSASSPDIYNTFVSRKHDEQDFDFFTVDGLLSYNKDKNEFEIGDPKLVDSGSYEGNRLRYNPESNELTFKGKLNLLKPTKNFKIEASGAGAAKVDSSLYLLDAFMAFDLDMPKQALSTMAKGLKANVEGLASAVSVDEESLARIADFLSNRDAVKYKEESASKYVPLPDLSSKLVRSLLLNDVNLKWSEEKQAWYSVGKIGLASILKEDINAQMDGYLELRQEYGNPVVTLYLQSDTYNWYYFNFIDNGLIVDSSDDKFNRTIRSKSKGSREVTAVNYGFFVAEPEERTKFISDFRTKYRNGKEDFKLSSTARSFDTPEPVGYDYDEEEESSRKRKKRKKNEEEEYN